MDLYTIVQSFEARFARHVETMMLGGLPGQTGRIVDRKEDIVEVPRNPIHHA